MEFLGDAVLGLCICEWLYRENPDFLEGDMTKIKSSVVSRKTCAQAARDSGLNELLEVAGDLNESQRQPTSVAAAVFESVIGALYLDGGFPPAREFILRSLDEAIQQAMKSRHQENFKSMLQQYVQQKLSKTPEYLLLDEKGPDHDKCFEIAVCVDTRNFPGAWGRSKKDAEQAAARVALVELNLLKATAERNEP